MHGAGVAGWLTAGLCAGAGVYCLARLRSTALAAPGARGTTAIEAVMGLGMAAMALPVAGVPVTVFVVVFGVLAAWSLAGVVHAVPHCAHHLAEAGTMLAMAAAMTAGGHHGLPVNGGAAALTWGALAYFAGYVLVAGARLVRVVGPPGSPRVSSGPAACRLALAAACLTMLLST